jgi:hypothetical protein
MSIVQVCDLNLENSSDFLQSLSPQERNLVKYAVARAVDTRKVVGGASTIIFGPTSGANPRLAF